jgi:metallo-beta-lactamase class B
MAGKIADAIMRCLICLVVLCVGTAGALAQGIDPRDRRAVQLQFDSWKLPVPPRHLIGNINYVGAAGVSSFLIIGSQGHILVDTGFEETVPQIQKGIEQLGFRLQDVKFILSSHAHVDHVGGHALMKKLTGATIVASEADARLMADGGENDFSPFPRDMMKYTPIKADRIIRDGEQIVLGEIMLTAHLTPGHSRGATTWSMQVIEGSERYRVVFFSSVGVVRGTGLFTNPAYPGIVEDYERTFKILKELPCDVYLAPHGGQFAMSRKFSQLDQAVRPNPLIDPEGWKRMIADAEASYRNQLTTEKAAPTTQRR